MPGTKVMFALAAAVALAACSTASDLHSGQGSELVGHPLFTARDAFVVDHDATFLHPRVFARLYFVDPGQAQAGWRRNCLPEYQANLHHWEEHARLACDGEKLIPLPVGTALQIDTLDRSWDFENGTRYSVTAHLLDPALTPHEIQLQPGYFLEPGRGVPWHLNPYNFTAQPPAKP